MGDVELKIVVNGKQLAANEFVRSMFWETLCGMVRPLKGAAEEIESIEIRASRE